MKTEIVPVRMNKDMLRQLDSYVKKLDERGRSHVLREALECFFKSDQPELRREMIEEFSLWRKSFWRVGTNLNQITYKMNANHPLSSAQLIEVLEELRLEFKQLDKNMRKIRMEMDLSRGY